LPFTLSIIESAYGPPAPFLERRFPVNISRYGTHARATAALVTGLIALPVVTAPGHDGPTRAPKVPELAISVSDGQASARPGQVLTYTASLRNTGTAGISKLEVTETLSAGLKVTSASDNGVVKAGQVTWSTALPAAGTRKFLVTARVTKTPAQILRLAAVACVTLSGGRQPAVCAAHLDRLPAAAAGPASRPAHWVPGVPAYTAGGLAVLALGLLTAIAARRRGRLRRRPA
jgi:uncharacterized repeat protein (TIGR01451 family)